MNKVWRALRHPTVRSRLTVLYAAIFAVCGVALVVITFELTANGDLLFPGVALPLTNQSGQSVVKILPDGTQPPSGGPSMSQLAAAAAAKQAETLRQLAVSAGIALALMVALAVALSWLAAGRVLRPLRSITQTAQRLSQHNLQQRIALDGPHDELRDLADTIDAMLDRLARAFEAQRRFVANASHELRTPLTRERALVDVTLADPEASVGSLRAMAERVRIAIDEQERLIDGLLTLARGERGIERYEPMDLAGIARRAIEAAGAAPGHPDGVNVHFALSPASVIGDPELVERAAFNVVDNAMTHNVEGGRVEVVTALEGGQGVLRVINTGPVVPKESVAHLFEPFRRRGHDRAGRQRGHGLGLSIVASIVGVHGGTVHAEPQPAGGLDVTIRLPAAAS